MKKLFVLLFLVLILPGLSYAGLLGSIGSLVGVGGSSANIGDSSKQLISQYVSGTVLVLQANQYMGKALGLKNLQSLTSTTSESLSSGSVNKDSIEKATKIVGANSKLISESLQNKSTQISSNSKVMYAKGLLNLAQGLLSYISMTSTTKDLVSSISTSPVSALQAISDVPTVLYIAKTLPSTTKNLYSTLKTSIAFAKSNNIPVPEDATKALGSL